MFRVFDSSSRTNPSPLRPAPNKLPYLLDESRFNIHDWLNYKPPFDQPHFRNHHYYNRLAKNENTALRNAILKALSPYRDRTDDSEIETAVKFISDCDDIYWRTTLQTYREKTAIFYRINELTMRTDALYDSIFNSHSQAHLSTAIWNARIALIVNLSQFSVYKQSLKTQILHSEDAVAAIKQNDILVQGVLNSNNISINSKKIIHSILNRFCNNNYNVDLINDIAKAFTLFWQCVTTQHSSLILTEQIDKKLRREYFMSCLDDSISEEELADQLIDILKDTFPNQAFDSLRDKLITHITDMRDEYLSENLNDLDGEITELYEDIICEHPTILAFFGIHHYELDKTDGIYETRETGHSLEKNMLWVFALIQAKRPVLLRAPLTMQSFMRQTRERTNVPSAFANEISGLLTAGYKLHLENNSYVLLPPETLPHNFQLSSIQKDSQIYGNIYHRLKILDDMVKLVKQQINLLPLIENAETRTVEENNAQKVIRELDDVANLLLRKHHHNAELNLFGLHQKYTDLTTMGGGNSKQIVQSLDMGEIDKLKTKVDTINSDIESFNLHELKLGELTILTRSLNVLKALKPTPATPYPAPTRPRSLTY